MKIAFTLLLLCCFWDIKAQNDFDTIKLSNRIQYIVDTMSTINIYDVGSGESGYTSNYNWFYNLKADATKEELLQLVNHSNAVINCYAFLALIMNRYDDVDYFQIAKSKLNSKNNVRSYFGCISGPNNVAENYFYLLWRDNHIYPNHILNEEAYEDFFQIVMKMDFWFLQDALKQKR